MSSNGGDSISDTVGGVSNTLNHWIDEGVGEVTGRNKERAAMQDAADLAKAAGEQENARTMKLMQAEVNDINASNVAARMIPRSARVPGTNTLSTSAVANPDDETDRLGR